MYERSVNDGEPWHPSGVRLSAFMVSVAVFEAVMGADHGIYWEDLTAAQLDVVLAPLRPLSVPGPIAGAQLYAGDGLLTFADGDDGASEAAPAPTRWVYLASTDADRLRYTHDVSGMTA